MLPSFLNQFLADAVLKKECVKECPGVETILHCNPPCSYKLETVNGMQRCAVNYSAETEVQYFSQSSEPGIVLFSSHANYYL